MGVSTSRKPPKIITDGISYETRGEYYLFKIKTRLNPNKYGIFGSNTPIDNFQLYFDGHEGTQEFQINESGEIVTKIYAFEEEGEKYMINESGEVITEKNIYIVERLLKQMILNEEDFGTFTENGYFIIKIKKEILAHENPRLRDIYLNTNDGNYIHEVYYE
jgi:hypothetical protein